MLKSVVFSNGALIGRCDLDPPMGVVSGALVPSAAYREIRPRVDAVFRGDGDWATLKLEVFIDAGRPIRGVGGIMIEDMIDPRIGDPPTVVIFGVEEPHEQFKAWFGRDPHYLSYYGPEEPS
jgi:hypothetical protein